MKLETDRVLGVRAPLSASTEGRWPPTVAAIFAALAAIVVLYWETAHSMIGTWTASHAYNHGYLIVPIALWLAWRKRAELAKLSPAPEYLGFALLAAAGFAWLLAEAGRVLVVQQYALTAMPAALVLALAGRRAAGALAFPLAFLFFAVPSGEALVPRLMDWTADFTVAALRISGIPVYREGNVFSIPSGHWSVVEACAGLRYLIASLTVGTLFAYLNYRRLWKLALFVGVSVLVPVFANFMRAYLIVMIGHLSNMKLGVGVDHMLFGWVFFGAVIMVLFWFASFWRDAEAGETSQVIVGRSAMQPSRTLIAGAAAGTVALAAAWPIYAAHLDRWGTPRGAPELSSPPSTAGWQSDSGMLTDWRPHYAGAAASTFAVYRKGERAVALYIAYYRDQRQGAELVSWQNAIVRSEDRLWTRVGQSARSLDLAAAELRVRETRLRSAGQRLLVWDWYRVAGSDSSSPYVAKALLARDKLLGRGDDSVALVLAAPYGVRPDEAAQALSEFVRDMLPAIERALAEAAGNPA
jgi:exosortase A